MARDLIFGRTSRDWGIGSIVLPASQERRLLDKVDDVRYDARKTTRVLGIGLGFLSASIALVGLAGIYHSAKKER